MSDAPLIRVLTVDDHPLLRGGIASAINLQPDMRVIAEAKDTREALDAFRGHLPDITLMDIRMPGKDGVEALSMIRSEFPAARVIMLTTYAGDAQAVRAFRAGAVGYLLKDTLRTELAETIRTVHAGMRRIPPEIANAIAEHATNEELTTRELDVLRSVADGKANKIVADELSISEHTVKGHMKSIMAKLRAEDRTHAVTIALRRGFFNL